MVLPAIPLAAIAGIYGLSKLIQGGSALYNQSQQRNLYEYQKRGYQRQLADWQKNVGSQGRSIKYPELTFPGNIRSLDTGISQSYSSSVGTGASLLPGLMGLYSAGGAISRYL